MKVHAQGGSGWGLLLQRQGGENSTMEGLSCAAGDWFWFDQGPHSPSPVPFLVIGLLGSVGSLGSAANAPAEWNAYISELC